MMSDLPANVRPVTDRHGKVRYRFRRKGWASAYVPGTPGTAEFHRAYADILAQGPQDAPRVSAPAKVTPRSLDDLVRRLKASPRWQRKAARTQLVQGRILERVQPRALTNGNPPSPARALSNLFDAVPRFGTEPSAA